MVSIISSALPNLSDYTPSQDSEFNSFGLVDYDRKNLRRLENPDDTRFPLYRDAIFKTLRHVIIGAAHVALATSDKEIILNLGAFGSGVFKNNPYYVARLWRHLLIREGMRRYFDRIVLGFR